MRSIVYNGVDLSEWCSAEVVEKVAQPVVSETMVVPGRAGALLVSGRIPPRLVRVRLFMTPVTSWGPTGWPTFGTGSTRRCAPRLAGRCGCPTSRTRVPRCRVHRCGLLVIALRGRSGRGRLHAARPRGLREGTDRIGTAFEVGGSWPTWPTFELVASAGSAVQVGCGDAFVRVEHAFSGGEVVHIDCEDEGVTIDGVNARADVTLSSDFFSLATGNRTLTFSGCASHVTAFHERWL